ncbi:hypothetical protein M2475_000271 [Breznakia sp. PF5-3]|uniref:hypothetical protein n=1 Tax=unclassified Breznakia TaxID=2623764 RepID=UPI00240621A9|nr:MULTISPECIES: hypothetical protein [unclassified Breznakia]MDF9823923.1 hypothetical protein [Breznakia sp. PM6-1]MDF9834722.1 hypothetical protein [Breznakia sp. PF5-3]MDF9836843.1 hypothetical protein [Breznakia sp. PFB2-8]MDF9858860.1 hypothetical protein [Breznakia sp. PH5-24]
MGENSRVKKYEDLRNSIDQKNDDQEIVQQALEGLERKSSNQMEETYSPSHKRETKSSHLVEETGEFKNEYLDSFIQEVREYNMKKGVRENEDTRLDILQQLSAKQREKRASYMEKVEAEKDVLPTDIEKDVLIEPEHKQVEEIIVEDKPIYHDENNHEDAMATTREIAKQVQELLAQENLLQEKPIEVEKDETSDINVIDEVKDTTPIQSVNDTLVAEQQALENDNFEEMDVNDSTSASLSNEQLFEETLKLRTQLDEYEEELTSLNDGVGKNNRLLNIIISVLIFMLLAVIGIVVYWLISGGII